MAAGEKRVAAAECSVASAVRNPARAARPSPPHYETLTFSGSRCHGLQARTPCGWCGPEAYNRAPRWAASAQDSMAADRAHSQGLHSAIEKTGDRRHCAVGKVKLFTPLDKLSRWWDRRYAPLA